MRKVFLKKIVERRQADAGQTEDAVPLINGNNGIQCLHGKNNGWSSIGHGSGHRSTRETGIRSLN